ncbi:hypothetical protein BGZ94_006131 [Podila epigama]|nr:hypothetical protein BGZ94_006131 [Podila epigama]
MYPVLGGIKKEVTLVTAQRPLSVSDPVLETLLLNQRFAILQRYNRAKGKAPSTKDAIELKPISYTTQVVAGTNYFVKLEVVHLGQGQGQGHAHHHDRHQHGHPNSHGQEKKEYIHVRIFHQPWTDTTRLTGVVVDQTLEDEFIYESFNTPEEDEDEQLNAEPVSAADRAKQLEEATSHTSPRTMIRGGTQGIIWFCLGKVGMKNVFTFYDPEFDEILHGLNPTLLKRYGQFKGRNVDDGSVELKPISYKTQVVVGMVYFVTFEVVNKTNEETDVRKEYVDATIVHQKWAQNNGVHLERFIVTQR